MLNHARTLILNRNGASRPASDFLLEEYVDPEYRALALPAALIAVHRVLIGDCDDAYANFRLWQYLGILHATEFEAYVLELDSRVTYRHDRSIVSGTFGPSAQPLNAAAQSLEIFFSGAPVQGSPPRLSHQWFVEILPGTILRSQNLVTGAVREDALVFTDGLSALTSLAGQEALSVSLRGTPTVGAQWQLAHLLSPSGELSELLTPLDELAGQFSSVLFGAQEPYRTFRLLWEKHAYIQYRLSGMLLAYVYRAEETRLNA